MAAFLTITMTPTGFAEAEEPFDCDRAIECDAADSCDIQARQGDSAASTLYDGDTDVGTFTAAAAAVAPQRFVLTTCQNVHFEIWAQGSASAEVTSCRTLCAASAAYDVAVGSGYDTDGAFCTTGSSCSDSSTSVVRADAWLAVAIPNTKVDGYNCAYSEAWQDIQPNGQWSDDSRGSASQCGPTEYSIRIAPL